MRYNQLPKNDIIYFLNIINITENLNLTNEQLVSIQENYKSDMRSMINYMQSNQLAIENTKVININIYDNITKLIKTQNIKNFENQLLNMSTVYNIDIKNIIKDYFNYMIKNQQEYLSIPFFDLVETIMHNPDSNIEYQLKLMFYSLGRIFDS